MSIKNDREFLVQLFLQADIQFCYGCHGNLEDDWEKIKESDDDSYVTARDDDDGRIGFAFDENGNLTGIKAYK